MFDGGGVVVYEMNGRKRNSFLSRIGIGVSQTQLDSIFTSPCVDIEQLRTICHNGGDTVPSQLRARVWSTLLLGWLIPENFPILIEHTRQMYEDLQRACVVLDLNVSVSAKKRRTTTAGRASHLLAIYLVDCRLQSNALVALEPFSTSELTHFIQVFLEVFPEDCMAYYAFQKRLVSSKAALNDLCLRTAQYFQSGGSQDMLDELEVNVETLVRPWFRSLFQLVFAVNVKEYLDHYFAVPPGPEADKFLCATAVALIKLNLTTEAKTMTPLRTTNVAVVMQLARSIKETI